MLTPKLDGQPREQIKSKGKDPHFGAERSPYKIHDRVPDVVGPLTCLWADLLNKEGSVTTEDVLLLIQRALVLLGDASHAVNIERRKIVLGKINPKLKSLGAEDYGERGANLFGLGFLEKVCKSLEEEKTLAKIGQPPHPKKIRFDNDRSDLRSFSSKGALAWGGSARIRQYQQPPIQTPFN